MVWFSGRAVTDRDARMVEFTDIEVERIKFPQSTSEQEKQVDGGPEEGVGKWMPAQMALDRLLAVTAAIEKGKGPGRPAQHGSSKNHLHNHSIRVDSD